MLIIISFSCFSQENAMEKFQRKQDAHRKEFLKPKNSFQLHGTVIEEHYLCGLVTKEKDYLKFKLPFDLHSPDCGAPDCYTTELTFEFLMKSHLKFPKHIEINGIEFGCVKSENWKSSFKLIESNENLINYFSSELKSNLYFTKKGRLIYFHHNKEKSLILEDIDKMYENFEFENAEYTPYTSTIMERIKHERFMDKK